MTSERESDPAETKQVIDEIRELGYGKLFEDRDTRRKMVFGFLAENSKGETAEFAEQLRDGKLTSVQVLSDPTYAEFIKRGVESMKDLDPDSLRDQLDELAEMDGAEDAPDDPLTMRVEGWVEQFSDFDGDGDEGGKR